LPIRLHPNWGGSGASQSYTVVDPQLSNLGGNVLQNSGFDTFDGTHANQPDNWVKVTGTAGTDYAKEPRSSSAPRPPR
jgi:hypothetical protein